MSVFVDEFFEDVDALRNAPLFEADGVYIDALAEEVRAAVHADDVYLACTNTGTSALIYALEAVGVERGDEVVLSAWSFISDLLAVEQLGATPVFVDVDPKTWLMDPSLLDYTLSTHRYAKAVLAVDMFGAPCDYLGLVNVCEAHNVPLVEDAADALGQPTPLGRCGAVQGVSAAATSFNFAKPLGGYTTGGAVLLRSAVKADELNAKFNYGQFGEVEHGVHEAMSGLTCALAAKRLRRRATAKARRLEYLAMIRKYLNGVAKFQEVYPNTEHSWYNVTVVVDDADVRKRLLMNGKICKDAMTNLARWPRGVAYQYPVAADLAARSITFFSWPCSPLDELEVVLSRSVQHERRSIIATRLAGQQPDDDYCWVPSDMTTPAYVVNVDKFAAAYRRMQIVAKSVVERHDMRVLYAVKANPVPELTQVVDGVACSGVDELDFVQPGVDVHVHAPALADSDLQRLLKHKVTCVVLSTPEQVRRFAKPLRGQGVSVGIRLDPFCASRHGAPFDEWLSVDLDMVDGVHVHDANLLHYMVVPNVSVTPLAKLLMMKRFDWLNLGGGFAVNEINDAARLIAQLPNVPEVVYIEPGRALVESSTVLVCTVLDVKPWRREVVVDASAHCHANTAALGGKQLTLVNEPDDGERWFVHGPVCTASDLFGEYRFNEQPVVGQRLMFANAGAYTISFMNRFNGLRVPDIALIKNGKLSMSQFHL